MPSRENPRASRASTRSGASSARTKRSEPETADSEDGEVWDDIMNMKTGGSGGDGSFNKMNTNFFTTDKDGSVDIVVLDDNPYVFWSHTIKCQSQAGKTFYRTEKCQKSEQDHCVLCETDNKAVSKARKTIAFRVLDSRGQWDREINGFDGEIAPKIFLTPLYLAKQLKVLKDDADGKISDKVLKIIKNNQYQVNFKMEKNARGGGLNYTDAPDYDGEIPDVMKVYAPMTDEELIDFVKQFSDEPQATSRTTSRRSGGQASSSFGK